MQRGCLHCQKAVSLRVASLRLDHFCSPKHAVLPVTHRKHTSLASRRCSRPSRCKYKGPAQSAQTELHHAASVNSGHQQQKSWPSNTRLRAMQDVGTASTEPLAQPLAICKSWLLSIFPLLRNEELVSRVAWTLMIIAIARLGLYMKLPYLDPQVVPQSSYTASAVDAMFGGSVQMPYNIFLLGVGPILNASIFASVFLTQRMWWPPQMAARIESLKESGSEGAAIISGYINLLGVMFAIVVGASEGIKMAPFARHTSGVPFVFLTMIILAAGTSVLRWLSDSVEARGLGDGISLLIALNIVSNYAVVLNKAALIVGLGSGPSTTVGVLVAAYIGLVMLAVFINSLSLRLPLIYYKQRRSKAPQASVEKRAAAAAAVGSTKQVKRDNAYLPISLNPNGMQALLFASFIYQLPMVVGMFSFRGQVATMHFLAQGKWYPVTYGLVVFLFGMIQIGENTPSQMTKYLNAIEAGVENVSPGPATERFLTQTMRVTRLWGALLVAILATAAQYFDVLCDKTMGTSLGSVSLLLIVGLISSCIRQVQSLLQLPQLERSLQRERGVLQRISSVH
ncbi:TPA: hypothetical protein ACH3X2_011146 [Trebouxia sp. C0005]